MKNKGFTLVELLGVIVLLGFLGVVIIPKVGDSITNSKNQAYNVQIENIKKGVNDFLIDNTYEVADNETITIKLGILKQGGYLPINIKNPITRKNFSNESLITITKNNNNYDIELSLIDLEDANETIDSNYPILVLNGSYIEYVNVKEPYIEKGATARSSSGEIINDISIQIKINDEETSEINTSELNTYNVIYSATDQEGYTTSATRTVIIRDNEAPKITIPKDTTLHISKVTGYDLMKDVTVTDNFDQKPNINVDSSLSNIVGKYVITYTATDSSGNKAIERRVITVTDILEDDFDKFYTKLDYIESTGTEYIDTGVIANENTGFDIKFQSQNGFGGTGSNYGSIFGARIEPSNNELQLTTYSTSGNQGTLRYGRGEYTANLKFNKLQFVSLRNKVYTDNDGLTTFLDSTFTTPTSLTVFALNENGNIIQHGKLKLYSFKLYDGNDLIRDFIPCYRKSDNETGLYDLVNNTFYTNSGTGKFIKGNINKINLPPSYQQVEYIESTGTQYIDTGVKGNENTGFDIAFRTLDNFSSSNSYGAIFGARTSSKKDDFQLTTYSLSGYAGTLRYGTNKEYNARLETEKYKYQYVSLHNGVYTNNSGITTPLASTFTTPVNLTIFALNQNGEAIQHGKVQLYSFKLYDGNDLIRNFVPCYRKNDNEVGLYDTVNNVFYSNNGTGTFTYNELQ